MKVKVLRDVGIDVNREVEEQDADGNPVKKTVTDHFKHGDSVDVPDDQAQSMLDRGHVEQDKE